MSQSAPPPTSPSHPQEAALEATPPAGLSIAAFVLGLCGLIPLLGLLCGLIAVILGIVALASSNQGKKGLAIAGLVLGVVLPVGSAALGVSVLLPGLTGARSHARSAMSSANLNGIAKAVMLYQAGNNDAYPPNLGVLIDEGAVSEKMLQYPGEEGARAYFYHPPADADAATDETLIACEVRVFLEGKRNILRNDATVLPVDEAEFQRLLSEPVNADFAAAYHAAGHR